MFGAQVRLDIRFFFPGLGGRKWSSFTRLEIAQLVEQLIVDIYSLSGTQLVTGSIPVLEKTQDAPLAQ